MRGNTYFYNVIKLTLLKGKLGPYLTDYVEFENDTIRTATFAKPWKLAANYGKKALPENVQQAHEEFQSVGYLVVQHNQVLYEQYWDGFNQETPSNSFSMAKSFVSALVGVSLQKGTIQSIDQTIADFLPDYKGTDKANITIKQLLQMSSGIGFDEDYLNPFAFPAKAYYGKDLKQLLHEYPVVEEPGVYYDYQGGATQLLAFIVEEANGKTLSKLFQEELWQPLGAESDAFWILDHKNGNEKASCCVVGNARDFAKIGKLYLNKGKIDSTQIIPEWYIKESTTPNGLLDKRDHEKVHFYGYQWWMGTHKNIDFFYARGILGQYIFVIPEKEMIVVRLGHKRSSERTNKHPNDIFYWLDGGLSLAQ
jgi:CubicO group peptidase (beta-lactamase class C family)